MACNGKQQLVGTKSETSRLIRSLLAMAGFVALSMQVILIEKAFSQDLNSPSSRFIRSSQTSPGMLTYDLLRSVGPATFKVEMETKRKEVWVYSDRILEIDNGRVEGRLDQNQSWDLSDRSEEIIVNPESSEVKVPWRGNLSGLSKPSNVLREILEEVAGQGPDTTSDTSGRIGIPGNLPLHPPTIQ